MRTSSDSDEVLSRAERHPPHVDALKRVAQLHRANNSRGRFMSGKQHRGQAGDVPLASKVKSAETEPQPKLKRKAYEREMRALHGELAAMQEWVKMSGTKVCVVFEGRDTAGKGGTIKRLTERVSPRVFRVVALPAPTRREQSQMYLQRYMGHFP